MENTLEMKNKAVGICSKAAIWIIALLLTLISVGAILETSHIDIYDPYSEIISFDPDFVLSNIALAGLTLLGILAMMHKNISIGKLDTRFVAGVMLLFTTVISLAWVNLVRSEPNGDALTLLNTAQDAAQGRYGSLLSSGDYYGNHSFYEYYPSELGYVFFAEILYRLFGVNSSALLFQIPNVIALDFAYIGLVMITSRVFGRKSVTNTTAILLTVCLQPMFMTTFTYSFIISLSFAVWAAYHAVRFMQENKIKNAIIGVVLAIAAFCIRTEYVVILIAIAVALIIHAIDKKKYLAIAMAALMIAAPIGAQALIVAGYAGSSGAALDTHVTSKMMRYSGISDSAMAPGWYNGLGLSTLMNNGMDMEAGDRAAAEGISSRMKELSSTGQTFDFLKKKLLSQVNEPAFESIWISQVKDHTLKEGERLSPVADSVYTGGLNKLLINWFHYYDMIIYIFAAAGLVLLVLRRKLNTAAMILPLAFAGGVIYHMLYEAKSQYMLVYFVLLIPIAACGLLDSGRLLKKVTEKLFK